MRYYYAELKRDEHGNDICVGVLDTYSEIQNASYLPMQEFNAEVYGKMWDGEIFVENPSPPEIIVELSEVKKLSKVIDAMLGTETEGATVEQMEETVDTMLGGESE